MKMNTLFKLSAFAAAIMAATAQAEELPTLPTVGLSSAVFTGGVTLNNGASFLGTVPHNAKVGVKAAINVASSDVGSTGSILVVAKVGNKFFFADPDG